MVENKDKDSEIAKYMIDNSIMKQDYITGTVTASLFYKEQMLVSDCPDEMFEMLKMLWNK